MLIVYDSERVRVQMSAELSDNGVREPPDQVQVFLAVVVEERGHVVGISLVGSRTHVADQVNLRAKIQGLKRMRLHDFQTIKISFKTTFNSATNHRREGSSKVVRICRCMWYRTGRSMSKRSMFFLDSKRSEDCYTTVYVWFLIIDFFYNHFFVLKKYCDRYK